MTKILSVANIKGGVGKSTFTCLLSVALAKDRGLKVAILDCDNQASLKSMFDLETSSGEAPVVEVFDLSPKFVRDWIKLYGEKYDIIFLDVPRITTNSEASAGVQLLYYCDGILIPCLGSVVDASSTLNFIVNVVDDVRSWKDKNGLEFVARGFINRNNQRSENDQAQTFLEKKGLLFISKVSDLKIFTSISFINSILDTSEGRRRFETFYNDFVKTFING